MSFAGRPFGENECLTMWEKEFGRVWREWGFKMEADPVATPWPKRVF